MKQALTAGSLWEKMIFAVAVAFAGIFPLNQSQAQTVPPPPPSQPEELLDCEGSILHGRTKKIADRILQRIRIRTASWISCENITAEHLNLVDRLHIENLGITALQPNNFARLTSITRIRLEGNQITNLPNNLFDECPNLEDLRIRNNRLTSYPYGTFDGLASLKTLRLSGNQITNLANYDFSNNGKITELSLQNNRLASIPPNVFAGLANLKTLHLQGNQLTSLPSGVFNGLANLKYLFISTNRLATLPNDIFDGLENLTVMDLNNNQLTALPAGVFDELDKLGWVLNLRNNHLTDESAPQGRFVGKPSTLWLWLEHNRFSANYLNRLKETVDYEKIGVSPQQPHLRTRLHDNAVINENGEIVNDESRHVEIRLKIDPAPSQMETIQVRIDDVSTSADDYQFDDTQTLLAWSTGDATERTIRIPFVDDIYDEPDEVFNIVFYNIGYVQTPNQADTLTFPVRIADNDVPGEDAFVRPPPPTPDVPAPTASLFFSTRQIEIAESRQAVYRVRATEDRGADMIVKLRSAHPHLTIEPAQLVFETTNWNNFQTITLRASATAADHSPTASIIHSIPATTDFIGIHNAGLVEVSITHTHVPEPEPPVDPTPTPPTDPEPDPEDPKPIPSRNGLIVDLSFQMRQGQGTLLFSLKGEGSWTSENPANLPASLPLSPPIPSTAL